MSTSQESGNVGSSAITRGTKRSRSVVWLHMSRVFGDDESAECHHCKKVLSAKKDCGTNNLRKHLMFHCPNFKLDAPGSGTRTGSPRIYFKFDQTRSRKALASCCIEHKYPFNIGYHRGFQRFCKTLHPEFKVPSRNTLRADVIAFHKEVIVKAYKLVDELGSKVSLTTDIWTSDNAQIPFCCLTCHYIDDNWELQKKILAFKTFDFPHDGDALFTCLQDLIVHWNLDKKLCSVVVDNASNNDSMIKKLKEWLVTEHLIPFSGDLLHVRCSAHILNLIVQDGLCRIKGSIESIRATVRYLKKSAYGRQKLAQVKERCRLENANAVAMDVPNRWNSTFKMLETALPLREVFSRLAIIDKNYRFNPSDAEWEVMQSVYEVLKVFYKATNHFSGRNFPTSNIVFPDVCDIHLKLIEWKDSKIVIVKEMYAPMKEKFNKYWDRCKLVLAVAVVFDPRKKMQFVQYIYERIYGEAAAASYIKRVRDSLNDLFILYGGSVIVSPNENVEVTTSNVEESDSVVDFQIWCTNSQQPYIVQKSELEIYLDEQKFPSGISFNVLDWWKTNCHRLPTLGRIARDILAVPATTVASEAAFSVGGRVLDEQRSRLHPDAVEALIVGADWIGLDETGETETVTNVESHELDVEDEDENWVL